MRPFIVPNGDGVKPLKDKFPSFARQVVGFILADGNTWGIAAGDEEASTVVSRLAEAMQMRPHKVSAYRLLVLTNVHGAYTNPAQFGHRPAVAAPWTVLPPDNDNTFTCIFSPARNEDMLTNQLVQLSLIIARQAQNHGGFLLHGALIEREGCGVILAGPGGVGKTTASRRLPSPWRSLSDDTTLVVRKVDGSYWAHPWPTWSNFMAGGPGGIWDVEHAVSLKAVFFIEQAQHDDIEPIGVGHSVPLIVELAEQVSWSMEHGEGEDVARTLRLQRFENICTLAKGVPSYHLRLSLDGAFWEEIERVIQEIS
jgi:hypothetical protein